MSRCALLLVGWLCTVGLPACGQAPAAVEVAAVWSGAEQEAFRQVLAAFERQSGFRVLYTATGDDIATVLGARLQGGRPPDLAILPQPGLLRDLAQQGALLPIEATVGPAVDRHYAPIWRELGSAAGRLYGLWFKAANKSTVWYNVGVFQDAGVEPPATWAAWLAAARTIADYGVPPFAVAGADGWTLTDWFENVYLRTAGPARYDQLTRREIPWTHPSVRDALHTLAEVFRPDWLAGGTGGALQTDFPTSVARTFARPPEAAMVYEGDFVGGVAAGDAGARLGTDADFFPFPAIRGSAPAVVGGGDVAVLLRDTPAAQALLRFLATPAAGEIWAGLGGFASPNRGVRLAAYPDDIARRSAKLLAEAAVFRFDMSDQLPAAFGGTPGQGEWQILQDFLRDPSDVQGTVDRLEAAARRAAR
ncbi:MAG: ABC transporter substrate-binding protein [Candidatus Methylomirabilales bacterium]